MRIQEQIQDDMAEVMSEITKNEIPNSTQTTFAEVLNMFPVLKARWDTLLLEATELKEQGMWKFK